MNQLSTNAFKNVGAIYIMKNKKINATYKVVSTLLLLVFVLQISIYAEDKDLLNQLMTSKGKEKNEIALLMAQHKSFEIQRQFILSLPYATDKVLTIAKTEFKNNSDTRVAPIEKIILNGENRNFITACRMLAYHKNKRATDILLTALADKDDAQRRTGAAIGLAVNSDERTLNALVNTLDDPRDDVAQAALVALQMHQTHIPWKKFIDLTASENDSLAGSASNALGKILVLDDLPYILPILKAEKTTTRICMLLDAIAHLKDSRIGDIALVFSTHADPYVRRRTAQLMGANINDSMLPRLSEMAFDADNRYVQLEAVDSIALLKNSTAPILNEIVNKSKDNEVVKKAIFALASTGHQSALEALEIVVKSKNTSNARLAIIALGKIKSPRVENLLLEQMESEDILRRTYAAKALGQAGTSMSVPVLIKHLSDKTRVAQACVYALATINCENANALLTNYIITNKGMPSAFAKSALAIRKRR